MSAVNIRGDLTVLQAVKDGITDIHIHSAPEGLEE